MTEGTAPAKITKKKLIRCFNLSAQSDKTLKTNMNNPNIKEENKNLIWHSKSHAIIVEIKALPKIVF